MLAVQPRLEVWNGGLFDTPITEDIMGTYQG